MDISNFASWFGKRTAKTVPDESDIVPLIADGTARRTTILGIRNRVLSDLDARITAQIDAQTDQIADQVAEEIDVHEIMQAGHAYHDDIQGILQTALSGVTQYTFRQYRSTGVVMPHIAKSDVFSMTFQMPHRKKLDTAIDSVHLHYIPIASANGNIKINYSWGWYNHDDVVPSTLPNSSSKEWTLATTDQYKLKIAGIIENLSPPADEDYSSILYVTMTRVVPDGTDWGNGELALTYMDAHFQTDRLGSYNEFNDSQS